MRIAIPERRGRVSPVFDAARYLWVVDIENGREAARSMTFLSQKDPLKRAKHVYHCKVQVLICGAISWTLLMSLASSGVKVIPFICGDIEEIVSAFCRGKLADDRYHMPGAGRRSQRAVEAPKPPLSAPNPWPRPPRCDGVVTKPHE